MVIKSSKGLIIHIVLSLKKIYFNCCAHNRDNSN
jgi:hypothetical protein